MSPKTKVGEKPETESAEEAEGDTITITLTEEVSSDRWPDAPEPVEQPDAKSSLLPSADRRYGNRERVIEWNLDKLLVAIRGLDSPETSGGAIGYRQVLGYEVERRTKHTWAARLLPDSSGKVNKRRRAANWVEGSSKVIACMILGQRVRPPRKSGPRNRPPKPSLTAIVNGTAVPRGAVARVKSRLDKMAAAAATAGSNVDEEA